MPVAAGGEETEGGGSVTGEGEVTEENPLGVDGASPVTAVIFDGGYGTQYAEDAGEKYTELYPEAEVDVSGTVNIQQDLQPQFAGGTPPRSVRQLRGPRSSRSTVSCRSWRIWAICWPLRCWDAEGTVEDNLLPGVTSPGMFTVERCVA